MYTHTHTHIYIYTHTHTHTHTHNTHTTHKWKLPGFHESHIKQSTPQRDINVHNIHKNASLIFMKAWQASTRKVTTHTCHNPKCECVNKFPSTFYQANVQAFCQSKNLEYFAFDCIRRYGTLWMQACTHTGNLDSNVGPPFFAPV